MQLDKFMLAMIAISVVATAMGLFFSYTSSHYDLEIDSSSVATFQKLNETYTLTEEISQDIKGASVDEADNTWDAGKTFKAGLNAIKVVFTKGVPQAITMVNSLTLFIPWPPYAIVAAISALIVVISFALIYLYFRYKN